MNWKAELILMGIKHVESKIEKWNEKYPIGTGVAYTSVLGVTEEVLTKTRSDAFMLGDHTAVVMIEGISGCVALSHLRPLKTCESEDGTMPCDIDINGLCSICGD